MLVAALVGLMSGLVPSYWASNLGIVDALRYAG
jgi:ABC-type lipoprotein release transport system permease subunit